MAPFSFQPKYFLELEANVDSQRPSLRIVESADGIGESVVIHEVDQDRAHVKAQIDQTQKCSTFDLILDAPRSQKAHRKQNTVAFHTDKVVEIVKK